MIKDYAKYALFTSINIVVSYALLVYLANALPVSEYAAFGVYSTFFSIAIIAFNLGHRDALFKYASQANPDLARWFSTALFTLLVFTVLLLLAGILSSGLLLLSGLSFIALQYLNTINAVHRGLGLYLRDALSLPIYRTAWLLCCMVSISVFELVSAQSVFIAAGISAIIAVCFVGGLSTTRRYWQLTHLQWPWANTTIRHFFLLELATITFMKIDVLVLTFYGLDDAYLAEYFFSLQLYEAAMLILAPVSYLFFNRIHQQASASMKQRYFMQSLMLISVVVAIGNLVWWLLGEWLLSMFFPAFADSYIVVQILLLVLFPAAITMLMSHGLFSIHQELGYAKIVALGLLLLLLLDTQLIPAWQNHGAAWARLSAEIGIFLWVAYRFWTQRAAIFSAARPIE